MLLRKGERLIDLVLFTDRKKHIRVELLLMIGTQGTLVREQVLDEVMARRCDGRKDRYQPTALVRVVQASHFEVALRHLLQTLAVVDNILGFVLHLKIINHHRAVEGILRLAQLEQLHDTHLHRTFDKTACSINQQRHSMGRGRGHLWDRHA